LRRRILPVVIAKNDLSAVAQRAKAEAIDLAFVAAWIASQSLSSGAHSRDPLARNDGRYAGLLPTPATPSGQSGQKICPLRDRFINRSAGLFALL
jgi:hypothetical protein